MCEKIKVKRIELVRLEGRIDECDKVNTASSYSEANQILRKWSLTAPSTGGYDKCSFTVFFEDEKGEYSGRYDLKHYSCEQETGSSINLKEYIGSYCRYMAGLEKPRWMSDATWEEQLISHANYAHEYRDFLSQYDV